MLDFFKKKPKKKTETEGKLSREEIIAQAKANAAKAREEIGDENIQRMAEALRRMEDPNYQSAGKRARHEIEKMDDGRVADNLKVILKEE